MRTVMVYNEKGGVGKTTLSAQLGAGLAIMGHKVLMVDADPQAHLTVALKQRKRPYFYNLLVRDDLDGGAWNQCLTVVEPALYQFPDRKSEGAVYLVPGNPETAGIVGNITDSFALFNKLEEVEDAFDYVFIDTAPTRSTLHAMLYLASDHIIIPTQLEAMSFDGIKQTLQNLQRFSHQRRQMGLREISMIALVPNMFRRTTGLHNENLKLLSKPFARVITEPIPLTILWGELSQSEAASIFAYHPKSKITQVTWEIVKLIAERVANHV